MYLPFLPIQPPWLPGICLAASCSGWDKGREGASSAAGSSCVHEIYIRLSAKTERWSAEGKMTSAKRADHALEAAVLPLSGAGIML